MLIFTNFDKFTLFLIGTGVIFQLFLIVLYPRIRKKKFSKLTLCLLALIAFFQSILIYGSFIEPQWIEVKHEQIMLNDEDSTNLKILFIADYHLGPYKQDKFVEKTVKMINAQNADLILIGGDFIYSHADQIEFAKPLENLKAKYGVYAILGNHDYGLSITQNSGATRTKVRGSKLLRRAPCLTKCFRQAGREPSEATPDFAKASSGYPHFFLIHPKAKALGFLESQHPLGVAKEGTNMTQEKVEKSNEITKMLEELNITVLRNEQVSIEIDSNKEIVIVGLEDIWSQREDLDKAMIGLTQEDNVILIEHNPEIILDPDSEIADLILSAHTHGGQIRIPLFGPITPLPTNLGKEYDYGLFELESENKLYITKGLGEMGPRARLFCRPEIVVLNVMI